MLLISWKNIKDGPHDQNIFLKNWCSLGINTTHSIEYVEYIEWATLKFPCQQNHNLMKKNKDNQSSKLIDPKNFQKIYEPECQWHRSSSLISTSWLQIQISEIREAVLCTDTSSFK